MSYKSENWKEKLEQVRNHIALKEGSVEKTADEILDEEIEQELSTGFEEDTLPEIEDLESVNIDEEVILEASAADMIDKLFNLKGDKDAGYGVAKMLNMTGVKVVQSMQKQNPQGFLKTVKALGKDNKIKLATNNQLMKMFKDQGVKPLKDEVQVEEETVSEEKLEKTVEKLTERNMLGRLAKQLKLNEEGKQKMFDYFEKGELKQ
jgi:predicted peroxiredoxin